MKNKLLKTSSLFMVMIALFLSSTPIRAAEPTDRAFTDESRPLELAILAAYPNVDVNGDTYISIEEANNYGRFTPLMRLANMGITGTMDGIEHFHQLSTIDLMNNELTGSIPENIGNASRLMILNLNGNHLSGLIPDSITNLSGLMMLNLFGNNLSGEIPENIGLLSNLSRFDVEHNNLSGNIPESFSNLSKLTRLDLRYNNFSGPLPDISKMTTLNTIVVSHNNFSGEVHSSYKDNNILKLVDIHANPGITGDTKSIFVNNDLLKYLDVRHTLMTQEKPDLPSLSAEAGGFFGYDLLNDTETDIHDFVTQEIIDDLQTRVPLINDSIARSDLRTYLDKTQVMYTARTLVNDLLVEPDYVALNTEATAEDIVAAKEALGLVVDGELKDRLNQRMTLVDHMVAVYSEVHELIDDNNNLLDELGQDEIDEALLHVNELHESDTKTDLLDVLTKVQTQYDNREHAKQLVEDLFEEEGVIRHETILSMVSAAKEAVLLLPDGPLKDTLLEQVQSAKDQVEARKYKVVEDFVVYTGTEVMEITLDGPAHLLDEVIVNDEVLARESYAIRTGSTIITLKQDYLKSLDNGEYVIKFVYSNEEDVDGNFKINVKEVIKEEEKDKDKEKVKDKNKDKGTTVPTGIQNPTLIFVGVLVVAIVAVILLGKKRKK